MESLKNGWNTFTHDASEAGNALAETANRALTEMQQPKTAATVTRLAALVAGVAAVALGLFALISSALMGPGGLVFGMIHFTFFMLLALAARDLYVISDKVANPGFLSACGSLARNTADIWVNAAGQANTIILTPDVVRWILS